MSFRILGPRELLYFPRLLALFPQVQRHASALLLPGSIAPAPHLTSPLCCRKARLPALCGIELSFIVLISSTADFSSCSGLFSMNEIVLGSTPLLPSPTYWNIPPTEAIVLHVLILVIEVYVETKGPHEGRFS